MQEQLELLEFIPEYHMYLLNGVVLPSVTQIVSWIVRKDYSMVPADTLKKKADYGNRIHEWVENYAISGVSGPQTLMMKISTDQWVSLQESAKITVQSAEKPVHYLDMYAGTYDMLGKVEDTPMLFDIKTTAKLDLDYLEWQMGMYKLAIGDNDLECSCVWMPKNKPVELIRITPVSKDYVLKAVEAYRKEQADDLPF